MAQAGCVATFRVPPEAGPLRCVHRELPAAPSHDPAPSPGASLQPQPALVGGGRPIWEAGASGVDCRLQLARLSAGNLPGEGPALRSPLVLLGRGRIITPFYRY